MTLRPIALLLLPAVLQPQASPPPSAPGPQETGFVCPPCLQPCHQELHLEGGSCATCGMQLVPVDEVTRVAVLLDPSVDLMSATLPLALLATSKAAIVYTVADTKDPLRVDDTLEVLPQYAVDDAPLPDVLVLPSGHDAYQDPVYVDWTRKAAKAADLVLAIEFGNLLLARTGLLLEVLSEEDRVPLPARFVPRATELVPAAETGAVFGGDERLVRAGKFLFARDAGAGLEAAHGLVRELGGEGLLRSADERFGLHVMRLADAR